jgi:hypothetical protein
MSSLILIDRWIYGAMYYMTSTWIISFANCLVTSVLSGSAGEDVVWVLG